MTEQEYFAQAEKELEELNQHRAEFMTMDFKELNNADYINFLEIGNRIIAEDVTLNVYELYKHPDTRAKFFATIAKIAYHVNNMFQTAEQESQFIRDVAVSGLLAK